MGSNCCLVNPAKEEYFEPGYLLGANFFRGFLGDTYTGIVLKHLISDLDGTLDMTGRWVGDPVILASSDSKTKLYDQAVTSFSNISYLAMVDLCGSEKILDQMVTSAQVSGHFLVHFVNAFSLVDPLRFHASIEDRLDENWQMRYQETITQMSWLVSGIDWHRMARK